MAIANQLADSFIDLAGFSGQVYCALPMTYKLTPRKQQLASFYEAFNGNPDALDRILPPDWVSHEPNPGQGKGRQRLKDFIGFVRKSVPDVKASVEDMIEESDKIAVRLTIAGTHRGPDARRRCN